MMKAFYDKGGITIWCGDNVKILPRLETAFDTLIADPPYGVSENTSHTAGRGKLTRSLDFPAVHGDDKAFDPRPFLNYPRVILWGANYYADKLPLVSSWLVWDKRDGVASDDNADCELAWTNLGGPARLFSHLWKGCIKASEREKKRVHPTQKPEALMAWCIERAKPRGEILDPFMGSGPVLRAAQFLGYRATGVEISEEYCKVAVELLRQPSFFSIPDAAPGERQGSMFEMLEGDK